MNIHVTSAPAPSQETTLRPTRETYDRFQQAYEHFNKALFGGTLPNALITLQRRKGSFGYFASNKFRNANGKAADEIALNPLAFGDRPVIDVLATLVHEMVHLWQHHYGTPGRGRYHNREWAEKMKGVGLQPTDNGAPEGQETGESVGHLIMEDSAFSGAAQKLIAKGFAISWVEAPAPLSPSMPDSEAPDPTEKSGKRMRYCCPECDLKAWAKHEARLLCGEHMLVMISKN